MGDACDIAVSITGGKNGDGGGGEERDGRTDGVGGKRGRNRTKRMGSGHESGITNPTGSSSEPGTAEGVATRYQGRRMKG